MIISCAQLKPGIEDLVKILGRSTVDMLMMDFERHEISLEGNGSYDMEKVKGVLLRICGPEGGRLVTARVQAALQSNGDSSRANP